MEIQSIKNKAKVVVGSFRTSARTTEWAARCTECGDLPRTFTSKALAMSHAKRHGQENHGHT